MAVSFCCHLFLELFILLNNIQANDKDIFETSACVSVYLLANRLLNFVRVRIKSLTVDKFHLYSL